MQPYVSGSVPRRAYDRTGGIVYFARMLHKNDLKSHMRGKPDALRQLYDQFISQVRLCGPVRILPEKTRIAFQVRMEVMLRGTHMC